MRTGLGRRQRPLSVTQNGATVSFAYGPTGSRVKKSLGFGTKPYPDAYVEPTGPNWSMLGSPAIRITTETGNLPGLTIPRGHDFASLRFVPDASKSPSSPARRNLTTKANLR